ncbi:uncharacterized protein J4E78_010739 [Alternaria triticimaculans]|uniref:uncharacterized protein n=1 Tax=Alternaria triticimaculans TaxID=297637 RepID=UPI0020C51F32|nr:uncharacterized protein J4E78_010739 [Alternaria triticimaculans]KAI4640154.1 hypothetical protein J4E78_010739 [Alternaria triticimaculans]
MEHERHVNQELKGLRMENRQMKRQLNIVVNQLPHIAGAMHEMSSNRGRGSRFSKRTNPLSDFAGVSFALKEGVPRDYWLKFTQSPNFDTCWKKVTECLNDKTVAVEQKGNRLSFIVKDESKQKNILKHQGEILEYLEMTAHILMQDGELERRKEGPTVVMAFFGYWRTGKDVNRKLEEERLRKSFTTVYKFDVRQFTIHTDHFYVEAVRCPKVTKLLEQGWASLNSQRLEVWLWSAECELVFCYLCSEPSHKQFEKFRCSGNTHCGSCDGDHTKSECSETGVKKCPNCGGPHAAWDNECRYGPTLDMRKYVAEVRQEIAGPFLPRTRWISVYDPSWEAHRISPDRTRRTSSGTGRSSPRGIEINGSHKSKRRNDRRKLRKLNGGNNNGGNNNGGNSNGDNNNGGNNGGNNGNTDSNIDHDSSGASKNMSSNNGQKESSKNDGHDGAANTAPALSAPSEDASQTTGTVAMTLVEDSMSREQHAHCNDHPLNVANDQALLADQSVETVPELANQSSNEPTTDRLSTAPMGPNDTHMMSVPPAVSGRPPPSDSQTIAPSNCMESSDIPSGPATAPMGSSSVRPPRGDPYSVQVSDIQGPSGASVPVMADLSAHQGKFDSRQ